MATKECKMVEKREKIEHGGETRFISAQITRNGNRKTTNYANLDVQTKSVSSITKLSTKQEKILGKEEASRTYSGTVVENRDPDTNLESDILETEKILKAMIFNMVNAETHEHCSSNSDESSDETTRRNARKKRIRRRNSRYRKVRRSRARLERLARASEQSLELQCASSEDESSWKPQISVNDDDVIVEESGSEISQDETYQDSIRKYFLSDFEQRLVKENLLNEIEKLEGVVTSLEAKLSMEMENSITMQKSLKEFKSDNRQLQRQKTKLQKTVQTHADTIENLKECTSSLKKTYDTLSREKQNESDYQKSELDVLKSKLKAKDEQLKLVKEKNEKQRVELIKSHDDFLAKVAEEARRLTETLSKALGCSKQPRETIGENVLHLLQKANRDLTTLSQSTVPLQETVKELQVNVESQNKTLSKVSNDKKSLRVEMFELSKQNKALLKEKAKLQREIESLKKESVAAKNLSRSFKTRLEELKANIRSIRREKETVVQEKQNVELKLKELGVDHDALKKEVEARKAKKKCTRSSGAKTNWLITPKVQEELKGLFVTSVEELDDLDMSLVKLEQRKRETKDKLRNSDAVREHLKKNTSKLVQKHEEMCKRSRRLDNSITKIMNKGEELKRLTRCVTRENVRLTEQADMFIDELNCGYMEHCALKKSLHQNCEVLARYVDDGKELQSSNSSLKTKMQETTVSWVEDVATLRNVEEELRKAKKENEELKSEHFKHERSLENYKELIRGYSRVASRSSEIQGAVGEMKTINRELLRFVALVQKQKEVLSKKVTGLQEEINLIQAMYQKLKAFSGKQSKKTSSISLLENNDDVSEKSLQTSMQSVREKLHSTDQLISSLKHSLDAERSDGDRLDEKIQKLFLFEERGASLELCALKISKKTKRSGFMNFKKRKSENEQVKSETEFQLNDKQLAIVIQLVQAKQQLTNEIKESLEMESRLCILLKHGEEYTEMLHKKCFGTPSGLAVKTNSDKFQSSDGKTDHKEMAELLKEKKRLENELAFKEAHEGLLEKQIALLKKQKKCCAKALRRYEEELDGHADQSIVLSLVDVLSTSSNPETIKYDTCEKCASLEILNKENTLSNTTTPLENGRR